MAVAHGDRNYSAAARFPDHRTYHRSYDSREERDASTSPCGGSSRGYREKRLRSTSPERPRSSKYHCTRSPSSRPSRARSRSPTGSVSPSRQTGKHGGERETGEAGARAEESKELSGGATTTAGGLLRSVLGVSFPPVAATTAQNAVPKRVAFMSKAQREKLHKTEERSKKEEQRKRLDEAAAKRRQFLRQEAEAAEQRTAALRGKENHRAGRRKEEPRPVVDDDGGNALPSLTEETKSTLAELNLLNVSEAEARRVRQQQQSELEQIKDHYLGVKREKKKIQKPSEKFRNIFNFEWDTAEDTSRGDSNPLYQKRVEPQLLFGRGFRAGIDVREQRKHNNFYDELIERRKQLHVDDDEKNVSSVAQSGNKSAAVKARDIDENDPNKVHWTKKDREEMTDRDWRIFREDFEIYIKGGKVPPPIRKWSESNLPRVLLQAVKAAGYEKPTPIQMQAIPIALEQRDLIGIAETGSGKTAAFVLPMLTYVSALPPLNDETVQDGPYALVLVPSRELAIQIDEETRKFASFCKCRALPIVGGRSAEGQAFELRQGVEIVIGTPGRVKDCLEKSYTVLNQCNYIVLDEADRMIDMGFEEIVNWILDQIPSTNMKSEDEQTAWQQELEAKAGYRRYRLTHMFSATMPAAVERLARKYLRAPAYVSIGDPGAGKRTIQQQIEFMTEARKRQRLTEILNEAKPPVMVFVNQKKVADVLVKGLQKLGFRAAALHGGKAQDTREASLAQFKDREVDVLVATDVAGRGLDVHNVQLVINFDMPKDIESYTHRIGRTGRAGKKGTAISFVTEDDSGILYDLKNFLQGTNSVVPLEIQNHPAAKVRPGSAPS